MLVLAGDTLAAGSAPAAARCCFGVHTLVQAELDMRARRQEAVGGPHAPMSLTAERCVACRRDAPTVTDAEIAELHPNVPEWELVEVDGIKRLRRVFPFDDFAQALAFTDAVGAAAEEQGHHPALLTEWGRTTVSWWTHKIKGLHRNDFIMAAKTDALYQSVGR